MSKWNISFSIVNLIFTVVLMVKVLGITSYIKEVETKVLELEIIVEQLGEDL
jgi:hypothetical protein